MVLLTLHSLEDTRKLGLALGKLALPGDVILLQGTLGAGKTTLSQFIAAGLEVPAEYYVTSPSFALMHEYPGRITLYHIDCYRLESEDDVEDSGLLDYIGADGLSVVEWPDRLGSLVPAERLELTISLEKEDVRKVNAVPVGESWQRRMNDMVNGLGEQG